MQPKEGARWLCPRCLGDCAAKWFNTRRMWWLVDPDRLEAVTEVLVPYPGVIRGGDRRVGGGGQAGGMGVELKKRE